LSSGIILVCPLAIRSNLSFIPSHKSTLWDSSLGSQDIQGPVESALFLCLSGFTSSKVKPPGDITADIRVIQTDASASIMILIIRFPKPPNDLPAPGRLSGIAPVRIVPKPWKSREPLRSAVLVVIYLSSIGRVPPQAGLTPRLSRF
jgi:hypothetical protein